MDSILMVEYFIYTCMYIYMFVSCYFTPSYLVLLLCSLTLTCFAFCWITVILLVIWEFLYFFQWLSYSSKHVYVSWKCLSLIYPSEWYKSFSLVFSLIAQSCLTLCDPMDCRLQDFPGKSNGLPFSFSRGSSWPKDWTWVSHTVGRHFTIWATREFLLDSFLIYPSEWYNSFRVL